MTPEERDLLNSIAEKVQENNEILHVMRRSMRWASLMRWIYWIVIIGSSIGAFYLIQPYLNSLSDTYGGAKSNLNSVQDILNSYKQSVQ